MTHKRFKRLLMAHGYRSREAEFAAWNALSEYGEYRLAWRNKYHALAVMRQHGIRMAEARKVIDNAMQTLIKETVRPMAELLREQLIPALDALKERIRGYNPNE